MTIIQIKVLLKKGCTEKDALKLRVRIQKKLVTECPIQIERAHARMDDDNPVLENLRRNDKAINALLSNKTYTAYTLIFRVNCILDGRLEHIKKELGEVKIIGKVMTGGV